MPTYNLRDSAFAALQRALMRGELAPGEQLDLRRIAAALGMSVTPLKEAVALLVHYGLLEIQPRRGTRVRPITKEALLQACEARLVTERWAAGVYTTRALPDERAGLRATLLELDAVVAEMHESSDFVEIQERFSELDFAYHRGIVAAAHNEYTLRTYESLATPFLTARAFALMPRETSEHRLLGGQAEHWRIYQALEGGEAEQAVAEITRHVEPAVLQAAEAIAAHGGVA